MTAAWGVIKADSRSNSTYHVRGNQTDQEAVPCAGICGCVVPLVPTGIMLGRVISHQEYDHIDSILVGVQTLFLISSCFCIIVATKRLQAKPAPDEEALVEEKEDSSISGVACLAASSCSSVISTIAFSVLFIIRVNEILSFDSEG